MEQDPDISQKKISKKIGLFERAGKSVQEFADKMGEGAKKSIEQSTPILEGFVEKSKETFSDISDLAEESAEITVKKFKEIKKEGLFKGRVRKKTIDDYNNLLDEYEVIQKELSDDVSKLYISRLEAMLSLKEVEIFINNLSNSPKEFGAKQQVIELEMNNFDKKRQEIITAEKEAERAEQGVGAGASLSALGVAVAALGPSVAMGVATTFGTASTGVAISTLSGAAASNAALAWLGGGALAAGGSGIAGGAGFLALAGPVGWTIAGAMLALSAKAGYQANKNNAQIVEELQLDSQKVQFVIAEMKRVHQELAGIRQAIAKEMDVINSLRALLVADDYQTFSDEEKMQAGMLVNSALTLAQMVNKEVNVQLELEHE